MSELQQTFSELLSPYTPDKNLINELWTEIDENYSSKKRYYHSLRHLENLLIQLTAVKDKVQDWNTILFTLYYHDIIYNASKSNNEERSADLAEKRMKQISVPSESIELCKQQIIATKSHSISDNVDTNYFTDADLSILGQNWDDYLHYAKNVRKEYSIYPDILYNPGRKKVLLHFLAMDRIFKTEYFFGKLEESARANIQQEIALL